MTPQLALKLADYVRWRVERVNILVNKVKLKAADVLLLSNKVPFSLVQMVSSDMGFHHAEAVGVADNDMVTYSRRGNMPSFRYLLLRHRMARTPCLSSSRTRRG